MASPDVGSTSETKKRISWSNETVHILKSFVCDNIELPTTLSVEHMAIRRRARLKSDKRENGTLAEASFVCSLHGEQWRTVSSILSGQLVCRSCHVRKQRELLSFDQVLDRIKRHIRTSADVRLAMYDFSNSTVRSGFCTKKTIKEMSFVCYNWDTDTGTAHGEQWIKVSDARMLKLSCRLCKDAKRRQREQLKHKHHDHHLSSVAKHTTNTKPDNTTQTANAPVTPPTPQRQPTPTTAPAAVALTPLSCPELPLLLSPSVPPPLSSPTALSSLASFRFMDHCITAETAPIDDTDDADIRVPSTLDWTRPLAADDATYQYYKRRFGPIDEISDLLNTESSL